MSADLQKWNVSIVKSFIDYCESKVESQAIEELRTYLDEWQKTDIKPVASDFTMTRVRDCTRKRKLPENECRCMARVWRDSVSGVGGRGDHRCTRVRNPDEGEHGKWLCTVHAKDVNLFGDDLRSSGMKDWAKRPSKEVNGKTVKAKSWFGWFIDPKTGKHTDRISENKAGEIAIKWDDKVYARKSRKSATKKSRKVCLINASDDESSDSSQEKAVTKKKGRGRPKKQVAENTSESSQEKAVTKKKARGRPKKQDAENTSESSQEETDTEKVVAENASESNEKVVAENTSKVTEEKLETDNEETDNEETEDESHTEVLVDKKVTKKDVEKLFDEDLNSDSSSNDGSSSDEEEEELEVYEFSHEGTEYFALKDGTLLDGDALEDGEEKPIGKITGSFSVNEDDEIEKGENFAIKLNKKKKKKSKKSKKSN